MDQRKVFLMPLVAEADFATLRALMRNQPDFPPNYDRWHVFWAGVSSRKRRRASAPPSSM